METLKSFVSDSKTFDGFTFRGSYGMSNEIFCKLFDHYQSTGENHLDAYSKLIYLNWEISEGKNVFRDDAECSMLRAYVTILRRLELLSVSESAKFLNYIKACMDRYVIYLESQRNEPRKKACCYTARPEVKEWVFGKYGKRCLCCGATDNISIDHIKPISKGGTNELNNLQPLCKSCNSSKSTRMVDYRHKAKMYFAMNNISSL